MKITKLGHCALILEEHDVRLLTDPGSYTVEAQDQVVGLDAIIITHEHQDHFHIDSLKAVLKNNPHAVVVTNGAVGALLEKEGIVATRVGDSESTEIKGIKIEGFGRDHALVYPPNMGLVENTGYMVAQKFYFPGDNFHSPERPVDILALPVAGPWMKMADAIDFAKVIKARVAFGVHDGMVMPNSRGFVGTLMKRFVPETEYVALADGETREF